MISRTGGFLSHTVAAASLLLATPAISALTPVVFAQPAAAAARDTSKKKDLPLTAGRKVAFTTDKASWMSLDVSPGRSDDRLRCARRPLHVADRGWQGDAADERNGV